MADHVAPPKPAEKAVLKTGQMQLFSYHTPALKAGIYNLTVNQKLDIKNHQAHPDPLQLPETRRSFRVTAPRFSLPPGDIHSFYPPNGHADLARVLPHIVFSDPHLPWERPMPATSGDSDSSRMPWLGVLPFTSEELRVDPSKLSALGSRKPSDTLSFHMTLDELLRMRGEVALPFDLKKMDQPGRSIHDPSLQGDTELDVVFLQSDLFAQLFTKQVAAGIGSSQETGLERFRYMCHVRRVHIEGMAAASQREDVPEDQDEFSVAVSPRSGPTQVLDAPVRMTAHLLSLEGIKENMVLQNQPKITVNGKLWVALVSLDSWSYQSLPEDGLLYKDRMEFLAKSMQPLRMPKEKISRVVKIIDDHKPIDENDVPQEVVQARWLLKQLNLGRSFIKSRLSTGEVTTALYHGPLSPLWLKKDLVGNQGQAPAKPAQHQVDRYPSSNGSDLQIIDHESGLADITYNVAWELGRSLAASDREFSAALMRLRSRIHSEAKAAYLATMHPDAEDFKDRQKHQQDKAKAVFQAAEDEATKSHISKNLSTLDRWNRHDIIKKLDYDEAEHASDTVLQAQIKATADSITATTEVDKFLPHTDPDPKAPNPPVKVQQLNSSDWGIVSHWCVDKFQLTGIPQVYLFPEPEVLPEESLRTFYIDEAWINCFIDGALSVANHAPYDEPDYIRLELKRNLNDKVLSKTQIPTWGFVMRSKVVQAFPDLQIKAPFTKKPADDDGDDEDDKPIPGSPDQVVKMLHLAPDTLLCLFDRRPEEKGKYPDGIYIRQPPHQQRFSVGDELTHDLMKMVLKFIPTQPQTPAPPRPPQLMVIAKKDSETTFRSKAHEANKSSKEEDDDPLNDPDWKPYSGGPPDRIYDWTTRCLVFPAFGKVLNDLPKQLLQDQFNLTELYASWIGLQLNDAPLVMQLEQLSSEYIKYDWQARRLPIELKPRTEITLPSGPTQGSDAPKLKHVPPQPPKFAFPHIRPVNPGPPLKLRPSKPPTKHVPFSPIPNATTVVPDSFLYKQVYPLGRVGLAIPARHPAETHHLVFSIDARPALASSGVIPVLLSVTILVPAGRDAADLLRVAVLPPPVGVDPETAEPSEPVLAALPRARVVGSGLRWHAVTREVRKQRDSFRPYVHAKKTQTGPSAVRRALPATVLAIRLTPKGEEGKPLHTHPELSFVLEGCILQTLPCSEVDILFVERYRLPHIRRGVRNAAGAFKTKEVVTRITVEKQA